MDVHVPVQNSEGKQEGGLGLKAGGTPRMWGYFRGLALGRSLYVACG